MSQDAFILDTGAGGIFAWLGSGATQQEKKAAFKNAVVSSAPHLFYLSSPSFCLLYLLKDFIQQKGYPNWTNVTCVREGAETPLFKQNFSNWLNKDETRSPLKQKAAIGCMS